MKSTHDETRRSFLRKLAAGTALVAAGVGARPRTSQAGQETGTRGQGETTYRETEEFREYYKSLRV